MPNPDLDKYIASLEYDPRVLLAVVPDGSTSAIPVKDRQHNSNGVIICTKTNRSLSKTLSEVAILSPTAGVIFPGALVLADQKSQRRASDANLPCPRLGDPDNRSAGT